MQKVIILNFNLHTLIISKKFKQGKLLSIDLEKKSLIISFTKKVNRIKKPIEDRLNIIIEDSLEFVFKGLIHIQSSKSAIFYISSNYLEDFYELVTVIRKYQHIDLCSQLPLYNLYSTNGFELFSFIPKTFPQIRSQDLCLTVNMFNHTFNYPIVISPMVGGIPLAYNINVSLAQIAHRYNIPMGVGSQKLSCLNHKYVQYYDVKKKVPNVFLIANIGFTYLKSALKSPLQECIQVIDQIKADALSIHVNAMQEFIQSEGNKDFDNILQIINDIVVKLPVPLIIKEVGCGIDVFTIKELIKAGVKYIDIAGKGGTSWNYIELLRTSFKEYEATVRELTSWGIPTALNLYALQNILKTNKIKVIASGGIRDGVTIAKAIALGASMVGIALPFLQKALKGEDELTNLIENYIFGIKCAMIGTGSLKLSELKKHIVIGEPYQHLLPSSAEVVKAFK